MLALTDAQAIAGAQAWIGKTRGRRTLVAVDAVRRMSSGKLKYRMTMRCECGRTDDIWRNSFRHINGEQCRGCAFRVQGHGRRDQPSHAVAKERRELLRSLRAADEDIWTEDSGDGRAAEVLAVRAFGAMGNAEIAILLGLSRERVRQVGDRALAKLRAKLAAGLTPMERALEAAS